MVTKTKSKTKTNSKSVTKSKVKSKSNTKSKIKPKISKKKVALGVSAGLLALAGVGLAAKHYIYKKKQQIKHEPKLQVQVKEEEILKNLKSKNLKIINNNIKLIETSKEKIKKLELEITQENKKYENLWFWQSVPEEHIKFIGKRNICIMKEEEVLKSLIDINNKLKDECNGLDKKQKELSQYEDYCITIGGYSYASKLAITASKSLGYLQPLPICIDLTNKKFKLNIQEIKDKNDNIITKAKQIKGSFEFSNGIMSIQNEEIVNLLNSFLPEDKKHCVLEKDYKLDIICNDAACLQYTQTLERCGIKVILYLTKGIC